MNSRTEINVSYYFHRKLALTAHVEQAIVPNAGECTDVYHTDFFLFGSCLSFATSPEKRNLMYACINSTPGDRKFAIIFAHPLPFIAGLGGEGAAAPVEQRHQRHSGTNSSSCCKAAPSQFDPMFNYLLQ